MKCDLPGSCVLQKTIACKTTGVNMATQGDDNKVVCSTNVNNELERNFRTLYKKFECILNNKNGSFTKKAESLVEVWQNLAQFEFKLSDLQYIVQIIDWAKLHTLNIVLTGEWKKFKDQYEEALLKELQATQNQLTKINGAFYARCQKLVNVINNPWSNPTLEYLVRTPNAGIGDKEIEFFCVETAYLTSVRLMKLCESQCEDLALNLVKAFMKCYRMSQTENFNLSSTESQIWFIFDIYVALLYKFKENDSLLELLKGLSAEEGLNLIKRFAKKRVKISKVWKHCHRIAVLASQVYISSTILKPIEEIQSILKDLLTAYISLNTTDDFKKDVVESVRSIIRLAETADHIYIFCDVFQTQFDSGMKAFIIELYIRALTTDMNLLERQKTDNEKEKMMETTRRLADGFSKLAEVLKGDVCVSRECIMTAFSLQPTTERIKKIEELAKLSGFEVLDTGQEWKCKLHPPVLPSDELSWICSSCGEYMCKPQLNVPLNTNIALNEALTEEKLGITRELCDDLVVLLSSPRYQVFSWLLNWPDLHRLCLMYLNDQERTKNIVTELKFLDIDYSIFAGIKKEPLDEYAGIERGYEHYLNHEFNSDEDLLSNASEDLGSQESRFCSLSSDSASEMHLLPVGPRKSDPNTLKSLRMFRPSLKRSRNNIETNVPEKVLKSESIDFAIPCSSKQTDLPYSAVSNNFVNDAASKQSLNNQIFPFTPIKLSNFSQKMNDQNKILSSFSEQREKLEHDQFNFPAIKSDIIDTTQKCSFTPIKLTSFPQIVTDQNEDLLSFAKLAANAPEQSQWNSFVEKSYGVDLEKKPFTPIKLMPLPQVNSDDRSQGLSNFIEPSKVFLDPIQLNTNESKSNGVNLSVSSKENNSSVESTVSMCFQKNRQKITYSNKNKHRKDLKFNCFKSDPSTTSTITKEVCLATQSTFDSSNVPSVNTSNPKNGQVATLQQVGGQVAIQTIEPVNSNSVHGNPNLFSVSNQPINESGGSLTQVILEKNSVISPNRVPDLSTTRNMPIKQTAAAKTPSTSLDAIKMEEITKDTQCSSTFSNRNFCIRVRDFSKSEDIRKDCISPTKSISQTNEGEICEASISRDVPCCSQNMKYSEREKLTDQPFEVEGVQEKRKYFRTYSRKQRSQRRKEIAEDGVAQKNFFYDKDDDGRSVISLDDISSCADTLINSDSDEYDCFSLSNPILNNVHSLDDKEIRFSSMSNRNLTLSGGILDEDQSPLHFTKTNTLFIPKDKNCSESDLDSDRKSSHRKKEPKYESYPDTGSDSQVELDSDDQYNRCYIELFKNNLLYDTIEGVCKNIDYYLKKCNINNNMIEPPLKRGKKSKKGCSMKKNRRSKTANTLDKTVLDIGCTSKPKSDIPVRDIRVILNRLPTALCKNNNNNNSSDDHMNTIQKTVLKHDLSHTNEKQSKEITIGNHDEEIERSLTKNRIETSCNAGHDKTKDDIQDSTQICNELFASYLESRKVKCLSEVTKKEENCSNINETPNPQDYSKSHKSETVSSENLKYDENGEVKNPKVVLERLSVVNNSYVRSVLANVPGLHNTELMRPANTDLVVNIVQFAAGRNSTAVPSANTQTSTQITPHIQRIGQPRIEKPLSEPSSNTETTSVATSVVTVKPTTSQPSTLINILSQQTLRPGQSNCIRPRTSPLINIVSHQIVRPMNQVAPKMITNSAQTQEEDIVVSKSDAVSEQTTSTPVSTIKSVTTAVKHVSTGTPAPTSGTILQFICKSSTLPKFQQAFGKTVYQANTVEVNDSSSSGENSNTSSDNNKKVPLKNQTVNIQPLPGSVIYTRQVPVGQTINLIPPGRQVFRIATSNTDQISLVKDSVIHSKVSAFLTAALQSKKATEVQVDTDVTKDNVETVTITRPALVQNARIVKPVIQIPSNVIRAGSNVQSNLSSTTLEQLREFDMVYKQIKERSNTGTTPSESSTQSESESSPPGISITNLGPGQKFAQLSPVVVVSSYCNLQPAASPALSVTSQGSSSPCVTPAPTPTLPKLSSKSSSKGKSLKNSSTHTSKASPVPKPQQKPQEDEHTTQRIFDILAEYAEQLRNSPDLNNKPAPRRRSNPPTNPTHNSKRKKNSSSKKPSTTGSVLSESDLDDQRTMGSEDSSCGVVQLSAKDDDQPNNQSTESNDSTTRPLIVTESNTNTTTRNLIIAESSVEALKLQNTAVLVPGNYIMPVSMVKGGQQIAVVSGGSKILATVPARSGPNMLLFQSFLNQNRKPGVPTVKYSTLQPLTGITSQNLAGVSGQSQVIIPQSAHNLTTVTLGQPLTLKKLDESDNRINTELLLAIAQPRDSMNVTENGRQSDKTISVQGTNNVKLDESAIHTHTSEKVFTFQKTTITTPIATPVISQTSHSKNPPQDRSASAQPSIITLNLASENSKDDASKTIKRVQSVLVTSCTSNGPMLSHTPPRYRKSSDASLPHNEVNLKGGYLHNGEKQKDETKSFQSTPSFFPNKIKKAATHSAKLDKELQQLCLQRKQAALDRELRLQKSLSEECEDLGVDEPSTSDLFPEADLLFDSNHSPSFDQASQDVNRRAPHDVKDKTINLFSDDDNSSSLRTEFLFDPVQYETECELQYEQSRQQRNGQSNTSTESGSSCEDSTLLQNCASMSDVTLNSPISPDFTDNPTHMNKYKFKYSNRKKTERHKQVEAWTTGEVSSSEDTMCSEVGKMVHSPKSCVIKRRNSSSCDEEEEFKVVRVSISKTDLTREEESCDESHCEDDFDSPSGRGARRSVKKMCSCCNGAQEGNRKRPSSRPHTPALHKKAFLNKKR